MMRFNLKCDGCPITYACTATQTTGGCVVDIPDNQVYRRLMGADDGSED